MPSGPGCLAVAESGSLPVRPGMLTEAGMISTSGVAGLLSAAVPGGAGSSPTRLGSAQAIVLSSRKEGGDAAFAFKMRSLTYLSYLQPMEQGG